MTIKLDPDLQKFVEQKVQSGDYASPEEAVNGLLSFVKQQDELTGEELDELRAEIAIGIEQADRGELEEWDPDAVWAAVEKRHAAGKGKQIITSLCASHPSAQTPPRRGRRRGFR